MSMEKLEELRQVEGSWLNIICNSRDQKDNLAWSVTIKYKGANAQYVAEDLNVALRGVEEWLRSKGALTAKVKPKLKLKRRTS